MNGFNVNIPLFCFHILKYITFDMAGKPIFICE